jgi:hypothetical protein
MEIGVTHTCIKKLPHRSEEDAQKLACLSMGGKVDRRRGWGRNSRKPSQDTSSNVFLNFSIV